MRLKIAVALALIPMTVMADDGDIYRCLVEDFISHKPEPSTDRTFVQNNREKTFDVFELADRFSVVSNSKIFDSSTTEYSKTEDGVLGAFGVAESRISSDTFSIGRTDDEQRNNRYSANIVKQSPFSVNTWFLMCVKIN